MNMAIIKKFVDVNNNSIEVKQDESNIKIITTYGSTQHFFTLDENDISEFIEELKFIKKQIDNE